MKPMTRASLTGGLMLLLAACTSVPTVRVPYYLPMTEVPVSVTRVVTCSGEVGDPHRDIHDIVSVTDIKPRYLADATATYYFSTREYQHTLSDSSISFTFHDDGRLSGVNASGAGKGAETIKAVAGILLTATGTPSTLLVQALDGPSTETQQAEISKTVNAACAYIDKTSPNSKKVEDQANKLLTLTYESTVRLDRWRAAVVGRSSQGDATGKCLDDLKQSGSLLMPTPGSMIDHCKIREALGDFHLEASVIQNAVTWETEFERSHSKASKRACLVNQRCLSNGIFVANPAMRTLRVLQCPPESLVQTSVNNLSIGLESPIIKVSCDPARHTLASFTVSDSARGDVVMVPLPVPKAFGGQTFSLALADSGRVTTLGYAKTAMGDAAGDAMSSLMDALKGPSAADEAKAMNDEADKIRAMQRLANCRANPKTCE